MKPLKFYFKQKRYALPEGVKPEVYPIQKSFDLFFEKFKTGEPFYFVRFGDGEFVTMMGKEHRNYKYNPNLAKEIEESIRIEDPNYVVSLPVNFVFDEFWASGLYKPYNFQDKMIQMFYDRNFPLNKVYHNAFFFQCILVLKSKQLQPLFFDYVRPMKKMFVGGASKEDAEKLYGRIDYYIQTPFKHAYERIDEWWPLVEKNMNDVELIIPAIGSSSNVVQLRLWQAGVRCYVIDFGSMIDAVGMKKTRGWLKKQGHKILKILPEGTLEITFKQKLIFLVKDIVFFVRRQIN